MNEGRLKNLLKQVRAHIYTLGNKTLGEYKCRCCNEWVGEGEDVTVIRKLLQPYLLYKAKIVYLLERIVNEHS